VQEGELSVQAQHVVFLLLAVAAAFRSGLFPMHSWLPALSQRAPVAASSLLFGAQLGPVLVARAFGRFTPTVASYDMSAFASWALASAVFTALLGLVQRDLKRSLGFVLTSQSALLLFGLCDSAVETRHGALLAALAVALTGSGLLLVAALLTDREQTGDLGALEGRGLRYPRLTALFFLLASAAIGLPGSLHFVAEDLLLHGLLHVSPHFAIILLLVGVLNGVGLLRLFFSVFQGPTRVRNLPAPVDLRFGHAAVIGGLLLATMLSGLAPDWLLTLQERSVHVRAVDTQPTVARVVRAAEGVDHH
jgi:NADH-quinone oxidoreductase subunit M